jgi:hypothetical protein
LLARQFKQYLIVDFAKGDQPIPEQLDRRPLFQWLPSEIAAEQSPLIVISEDAVKHDEIIDSLWDHDAVECLYSNSPQEDVLQHLVDILKLQASGKIDPDSKSMLGYCWPGVLSQLLAFRPETYVSSLMDCIDAILTEVPDLPASWQVFARQEGLEYLDASVFRRQDVKKPSNEQPFSA